MLAPAATTQRTATCRDHLATRGVADPAEKVGSDPWGERPNRVRRDNLTPNAASLAARLQFAGHVDDQTAADNQAQGNVEPSDLEQAHSLKNAKTCFPISTKLRRTEGMKQNTKEMPTLMLFQWKTFLTRSRKGGTTEACKNRTKANQHWK